MEVNKKQAKQKEEALVRLLIEVASYDKLKAAQLEAQKVAENVTNRVEAAFYHDKDLVVNIEDSLLDRNNKSLNKLNALNQE